MYEKYLPPYHDGIVVWFNPIKGYGFIKGPHARQLFVHFRDIIDKGGQFRRLYPGQEVRYRIAKGHRGDYAYNVFPIAPWFTYEATKNLKSLHA